MADLQAALRSLKLRAGMLDLLDRVRNHCGVGHVLACRVRQSDVDLLVNYGTEGLNYDVGCAKSAGGSGSMNRYLSRREWLGAAGVAAAATAVAACGSRGNSSMPTATVTVPAAAVIPTESARPRITNPDAALTQLMDGNARFVNAKMVHPAQDPEHRI